MRLFKSLGIALLLVAALALPSQAVTLDPENTLYLETKHGRVVIKLRPDLAPKHVERIKKLTREKFYDGIVFHRVIEGFMAQTGDPLGNGTGGSKYPDVEAEFNHMPFVRGTVGAAPLAEPEQREQPVLHMLRRRFVPQSPVHGLGRSRRGHGSRRQDQARRAPHQSGQDHPHAHRSGRQVIAPADPIYV